MNLFLECVKTAYLCLILDLSCFSKNQSRKFNQIFCDIIEFPRIFKVALNDVEQLKNKLKA